MRIFLVDLESVPTRYTCEWKTHIPKLLRENGFDVVVVEGDLDIPSATTPGAFLNFGGTNMYKAKQVHSLSYMFTQGEIKAGDHIIFTDAWHPGIINVKYMSVLLNIPVVMHGLWHAGSYDPNDFLGRLVQDKTWIHHAEKSFVSALDFNWLASEAHYELITKTHPGLYHQTGWPMEYTKDLIHPTKFTSKDNMIIFPHRIAPEKRLDLFEELSQRPELSHYTFVVPMNMGVSKTEYHELLRRSRFAVSFAEQETLGISMYEAACAGTAPIVPNRLSYKEMYGDMWKRANSIDGAVQAILEYEQQDLTQEIAELVASLHHNFFSARNLINKLKEYK
jgi:glycosyltransferase involved in cell wall biosynthesis